MGAATLKGKGRSDHGLFLVVAALALFGLVMVYSSSAVIAENEHGNTYHYALKHLAALLVGVAAAWGLARFDYRKLDSPAIVYGFLGLNLALLFLVLMAPPVRASHRWLRLGALSLQPSEIAKLALIVFLAYLLQKKSDRVNDFVHTLTPVVIVLCLIVGFVLVQPDLGTALSLLAIAGTMLFLAGLSWSTVLGAVLLIGPLAFHLAWSEPYRRARLLAFISPWKDPLGAGFQPIQSLIALGSGGVSGLGPAASRQKLFFLPEPHTDFVYAVIGEEFGFVGCVAVLCLYVALMMYGVKIALRAREPFGFLLATGVTTMIVYQAFFNISIVLSILPTKGTPLPFLSSGGSALVVCFAGVGLLQSIARRS